MKRWGLRLFALVVAIALFVFVNDEGNMSVVDLSVPIEVRNIPDGTVLISPKSKQIRVSIKGPSSLVNRIANSPPVLRVKLPEDVDKRYALVVKPQQLSLPQYVQVLRIEPSELELTFDKVISKRLTVQVPRIGEVVSGHQLVDFSIKPAEVTARGPNTELQDISVVETFPVDMRDVRSDFTREVAVRSPGELTEVDPGLVAVTAKVIPLTREAQFIDVQVELRASGAVKDVEIVPPKVKVLVSGPIAIIDALSAESVLPFVRIKDIEGGQSQKTAVKVDLPNQVSLISVNPAEIEVIARAAPTPTPSPKLGRTKQTKR